KGDLQMKVILKEDVKNLGKMGDILTVAEGHARNFLLPKKLAVEALTENIKALEHQKKTIQEKAKKVKNVSQDLANRISSLTLSIKAKAGEEDKIFGSITSMDIAAALKNEGIDIDKKKISLEEPIKRLGSYAVSIKIHTEISAQLNISVVPE
ncbi:MAG: 50S ribosomal protein L9, partial [Thermodesulfovibrionales bacterium]|nr:50S ribosomal protein L9 [Thermodesulfovibrionales bacterium]